MNRIAQLPPVYNIAPPFPHMDGKKIKVTNSTGSDIGVIFCKSRSKEGKFGVRIDFINAPDFCVPKTNVSPGFWEREGQMTAHFICLSEQQIVQIKQSAKSEYSFTLEI